MYLGDIGKSWARSACASNDKLSLLHSVALVQLCLTGALQSITELMYLFCIDVANPAIQ